MERLPAFVLVGLVAVAYFGLARFGYSFSAENQFASAVWPAAGLGLAATLLFGYRMLAAIFLGALVANLTFGGTAVTSAAIGASNSVALGCATWLLLGAGFDPRVRLTRDVVLLALLGSTSASLLGATLGSSALWLAGASEPGGLIDAWQIWFLGDLTGILIGTPLILILLNLDRGERLELSKVAEATVGFFFLTAATILILREELTIAYPVFPLLVLIALRYRETGAVIGSFIVTALIVYFTHHGEGPFIGGSDVENLLKAQLFVSLAALTALLVAASRTEWERSEHALSDLSESQKALSEAQEIAHIGSWEWNLETNKVTWSDELYRIFGRSMELHEVTFDSYMDAIHVDDRDLTQRLINDAIQDDRSFNMGHRILRPGGEIRHLDCQGRFVHDAGGNQLKLIGTAQDVTEKREAERKLSFLAMHDQLTGLSNRGLFLGRLEQALRRPGAKGPVVLFCDLDGFKAVNDKLGHEAGDHLLSQLAPNLLDAIRPGDLLARFGGDEFVVLMEDYESQDDVLRAARSLSEAFQTPIFAGGRTHRISASIGIVFARPETMNASEVLRDADAAMYQAKSSGRGVVSIFDEHLRADLVRRIEIESDLREAGERGELELVYQPILSIDGLEPAGVEALIRWRHPEWGLLLPDQFINAAERTGAIDDLGLWVLQRACRDLAGWRSNPAFSELVVTVNISASQISDANLPRGIESALKMAGLPADRLALEITESALLEHSPMPIRNLDRLRDLGIHLVLDDFGTGYSSLSYLRRIPINALKVDREFIIDLSKRDESAAIVSAILSMAGSLELEVVAEGVETEAHLKWLRKRGCGFVQGNYLVEPLGAEALREWILARKAGEVPIQD